MAIPVPRTFGEQIAWSYANLARAHAALEDGVAKYKVVHHIIRNKMYHGLLSMYQVPDFKYDISIGGIRRN